MLEGLRIGNGFDVHRLVEGRPLILGGITIPFEKGLDGHSDADALIHAIVDSILGALSLGDIGKYFSPQDARWKDASSIEFLRFTRGLVEERNGKILSIDSTLILERPKIGPHVESIRKKLSDELGLSFDRVHLKATTMEKMGFIGREEGIAAQAVCLLHLEQANT